LKLFDKIWNALGLVESDEAEEQPAKSPDKAVSRQERKSERLAKVGEETKPRWNPAQDPATASIPSSPAYKPTLPVVSPANGKAKLVLTQPSGFDDARQIAENVTSGNTVVVNFDRTDADTTKRTIDFMSGITYAVGGTVQRISAAIFLFAPSSVEVFTNERLYEEESALLPWRGQKGRDH